MSAKRQGAGQTGFTIVELMIATAVLSTIILLATVIIINIGNSYYKGITQSREQDSVRTIVDDVSQDVELSDQPVTSATSYYSLSGTTITVQEYCVGITRYSSVIDKQVGSETTHALWRDTVQDGTCPTFTNVPSVINPPWVTDPGGGTELIAPGSMLTYFNIGGSASPYTITASVAYGDSSATSLLNLNGYKTICKGGTGDQFCATARLSAIVDQRL